MIWWVDPDLVHYNKQHGCQLWSKTKTNALNHEVQTSTRSAFNSTLLEVHHQWVALPIRINDILCRIVCPLRTHCTITWWPKYDIRLLCHRNMTDSLWHIRNMLEAVTKGKSERRGPCGWNKENKAGNALAFVRQNTEQPEPEEQETGTSAAANGKSCFATCVHVTKHAISPILPVSKVPSVLEGVKNMPQTWWAQGCHDRSTGCRKNGHVRCSMFYTPFNAEIETGGWTLACFFF